MRTVLIAHRDPAIATSLEADFRRVGYHINTCPGPFPPQLRCIQCDTGYCPLTDAADVLIYDPSLVALDADGASHNLAVESALAHPALPMLVTSFTPAEREPAAGVMAQAQNVELGAQDRSEMLVQVNQLITSRPGGSSCSEAHRVRAQSPSTTHAHRGEKRVVR
jgi:hypothetical protein